ncbi:copper chaperone PCu(A)C [Streptacidiphilus sp. MAP5-3]|uniref:copper chaperone PCu(A)C n=1 Tax=unclassified Streptacidiphilus TaxID=2643834 RepID=UPI0035161BC7
MSDEAADVELEALEAQAAALEQAAAGRGGLSGARRTLLLQGPLVAVLALVLLLWGRSAPTSSAATAASSPPRLGCSSPYLAPPTKSTGPVDAYLTLRNGGGTADRLIDITTPWAATAQLVDASGHVLPWLTVPADGSLTLSPGGTHVELTALRRTPALHDTIQLDLTFATSGTVHVWAPVGPADSLTVEDVMHAMKWMDRLPPANQ